MSPQEQAQKVEQAQYPYVFTTPPLNRPRL